jgi:ABC-type multidrug transport system ATPase subunit
MDWIDVLEVSYTVTTNGATADIEGGKDVFSWKQLNYDISIKGDTRRLLSDVEGFVEPGTLTALMGTSRAGKTTLLDVLAQRVGDMGIVTGNVTINGATLNESFQRRTSYIQHQDIHMAEMTVREAFRFSASLRQAHEVSQDEKYAYLEKIISILGLEDYADAVVGIPGKGLSAEKRKRTTIGLELVARPSLLLFVDEPTFGLDSQSAWSIIKLLREFADAGQVILCTIHQPSVTLIEQFDRLLLLVRGGRTVYFGDLGSDSQTALDYFASYGAPLSPQGDNPAEYLLEQIGAGATGQASLDWPSVWATSERRVIIERINHCESLGHSNLRQTSTTPMSKFATPWLQQYLLVQKRLFVQQWRSPGYINSKLVINVFGDLFMAFTFYNEKNSIQCLQNKVFSVFTVLLLCPILMVLVQTRLIELRKIYDVREKHSTCTTGASSSLQTYWLKYRSTSSSPACASYAGTSCSAGGATFPLDEARSCILSLRYTRSITQPSRKRLLWFVRTLRQPLCSPSSSTRSSWISVECCSHLVSWSASGISHTKLVHLRGLFRL